MPWRYCLPPCRERGNHPMSARLDDRGRSPQALPGRDAGRPAREPVHIQLSSEQCDRARPAVGLVRRCRDGRRLCTAVKLPRTALITYRCRVFPQWVILAELPRPPFTLAAQRCRHISCSVHRQRASTEYTSSAQRYFSRFVLMTCPVIAVSAGQFWVTRGDKTHASLSARLSGL